MKTKRTLIASDGVELAYRISRPNEVDEAGRSTDSALLLLHGIGSNYTRWSEFVEETSLSQHWSVLVPDLRGNGESITRRHHDISVWCRDVVEILDAERFADALVIGHSLGAQVAIHLAHRSADRIRGLALIDPVFQRALLGKQRFYSRNSWLLRGALGAVRVANLLGIHRRGIPVRDLRQLDEETRQALGGEESFEVIAKRYGALGPVLRHMPTANFFRQVIATIGPLPPLAEIAMPVLVLMSGGITFADLEVSRQEVGRFQDHEIVTLEANHWPLTETPQEVRSAIEEWIGRRFPA